MAINLLPTYLTPKSGSFKVNNFLRTASVAAVAVLVVMGVLFLALFFVNSFQINSQIKKNQVLMDNIKNLEQAEARYVLVKDRISKAKTIMSETQAFDKIQDLSDVINSSGVSIAELNIDPTTIEFTIITPTTTGIGQFSKNLLSVKNFQKINITEFVFNPNTGYSITYKIL